MYAEHAGVVINRFFARWISSTPFAQATPKITYTTSLE
jgi:hypothetical protein